MKKFMGGLVLIFVTLTSVRAEIVEQSDAAIIAAPVSTSVVTETVIAHSSENEKFQEGERPTLVEKLKDQKSASARSSSPSYSSVFGGLAATLAIMLGLAWLTKKFRTQVPGLASEMKMLDVMSVGPREKVCVIKIDNKKLLLGVTQQSITVLHTFEESKASEETDSMFSEKIKKMLQNGTSNGR